MNLESCISLAMHRRWLTVSLSLLVMLVLAAGARYIVAVDVDVRNHFGKDDPHIVALEELEATYALSDAALVAVAPKTGTIFTRETLIAIEELTDRLWRTPYVTRVDSITNHSHSEGREDELIVDPLVDDAASLSDEDIERIGRIALATEEIAGRLVSRDGRVAGLVVSVSLPEDRERGKLEVTDFLYGTAAAAREKHSAIDYHLTGELVLNRAMRDAIDNEMAVLAPIALGTMLLVAIVLLRSLWGTVAIVVMLVAVVLSTLGFTGWTGMRLFGESGAALFVLMAVTVAHSVHIIEGMAAGLAQGNIEGMLVGTAVAMAIVSLLLLFVFRSVRLGLISLIPNFVPAAMAMGLWGYAVGEVGVAASVVTAIAFGIIVDDTIHFMTKYAGARKKGLLPSESVQSAFRSVGKALLVTTVVFGLGFMVFGASGMATNQALGLLVGMTVIIALLADFLFLPPLLMALDGTRETSEEIRERLRRSSP